MFGYKQSSRLKMLSGNFHLRSSEVKYICNITRLGNFAQTVRQFNLTGAGFSYFYHKSTQKWSNYWIFNSFELNLDNI